MQWLFTITSKWPALKCVNMLCKLWKCLKTYKFQSWWVNIDYILYTVSCLGTVDTNVKRSMNKVLCQEYVTLCRYSELNGWQMNNSYICSHCVSAAIAILSKNIVFQVAENIWELLLNYKNIQQTQRIKLLWWLIMCQITC